MPYKSDKEVLITGTKYDRRAKLDRFQRNEIRDKFRNGEKIANLSKEYGVSITWIRALVYNKEMKLLKDTRKRKISREARNAYMRKYRKYKRLLYIQAKGLRRANGE